MQARGQRETKPVQFFHEGMNNDEAKKRIWEQDMRDAEKGDKQDALAQRKLDAVAKQAHQAYMRRVKQDVAQTKEEKRRVESLERTVLLNGTSLSYRIGDYNVSGLTMQQRVETIEDVCNFVDGGNLDLSTRLTLSTT
jgi:hypothetical protein